MVSSRDPQRFPWVEATRAGRAVWPVEGPLGYDGFVYRHVTHLVSCWMLGLPAYALLRALSRLEVRGAERLADLEPPLLIVSNHRSIIDSYVVSLGFGLWPRGLYDARVAPFHTPEAANFMHTPALAALHTLLRCVPLRRGAGVHQPGIDVVIELLRRRNVVYMFPEGTRTRDGAVRRATPGVGRVLLEAGCAALPIHVAGTAAVLPIGARLPRPGRRITLTVGWPIPPERWEGLPNGHRGWMQAAKALLDEVEALAPRAGSRPRE